MKVKSIDALERGLDKLGYITDPEIATVVYLLMKLQRPLLLEGHAGVGKTEVATVLASLLDTELIRLQCYEGLDVNSAVYEWNYQRQLLAIKAREKSSQSEQEIEAHIFGKDFLLERPLLRSITAEKGPVVLLIDEIDRADEEFEAFLLELLSVYQISIPELGTVQAKHIPYVILTSNRTRELSDALKRRCLYHWIDYPDVDKELRIVHKRLPGIGKRLAGQIVHFIQAVRERQLVKPPGVAETLDWAMSLLALEVQELSATTVERTLGCILKSTEDLAAIRSENLEKLIVTD